MISLHDNPFGDVGVPGEEFVEAPRGRTLHLAGAGGCEVSTVQEDVGAGKEVVVALGEVLVMWRFVLRLRGCRAALIIARSPSCPG